MRGRITHRKCIFADQSHPVAGNMRQKAPAVPVPGQGQPKMMTIWLRRERQSFQEFRGQLLPARRFVAHRVDDLVCNARSKPLRDKRHHQRGWHQRRGLKVAPHRQFRGRVGNQEIGDSQCGSDAFRQADSEISALGNEVRDWRGRRLQHSVGVIFDQERPGFANDPCNSLSAFGAQRRRRRIVLRGS
jgi:hypothetical protein